MLQSFDEARRLSDSYEIPLSDILCTDLNITGISLANPKAMQRTRFSMNLDNENLFFAVTVNRRSDYKHTGDSVWFKEILLGMASDPENDTCDDTYFRKSGKVLTLNSNKKSACSGCKFCGTYNLDKAEEPLTTKPALTRKIESLLSESRKDNMSDLEAIGVVTGCFPGEEEAVEHLLMVRDAFEPFGFKGEVIYIGSQIRREESLDALVSSGPFGLYLTVECFTRREQLMNPKKASLTLERGRELLDLAKGKGINTTFLYILGLDPIESIFDEIPEYLPVVTRHPIINVMQAYVPEQEALRHPSATKIEYYLESRGLIEILFCSSSLVPRRWENYRSPWVTKYGGRVLDI